MKHIFYTLLCFYGLHSYAQQGTLKGDINTKNFREVSFVWNEYNPNILHSNQFMLKENGKELTFTCENISSDSIPQKNKTILFLWEDPEHPTRKNQYDFTSELLFNFFQNDVSNDTTTTFNIAVFNRKQGDESVLKLKLPEFISDKGILGNFTTDAVFSIWNRKQVYDNPYYYRNNPNESDLFSAIKEGLDLIGKEPNNNTRAIVVITAGLFSEFDLSFIRDQSLRNKIPIYVIYYPAYGNGNTAVLQRLSDETYGQLIISNGNTESTITELLKSFNELNRRHYGQDYKISFTSQLDRDGKSHPLEFNADGTNYDITRYYKTPDFSLIASAKEHLILFLILLVIIIAGITLGIIFGIKFLKKRKARITAQKQEDERLKNIQKAKQAKLEREQKELQEKVQKQQKAAEEKERQAREQEQDERLAKQMRTKNLQPRLITANSITFNIDKVTTTIGREKDNDIVLSGDMSVSRKHAKIIFNGSCFEIHDLPSSKSGVIVNGYDVESADLKNSDIIQLGETVMKFYE